MIWQAATPEKQKPDEGTSGFYILNGRGDWLAFGE
jgi:hypothetical protein